MNETWSSERKGALRTTLHALAIAAAVVFSARLACAADAPPADLSSVVSELRKGGYVIYIRHALTEQAGATDEAANLARCETQRNLSPAGREQASGIGRDMKALRIPVGTVLTSPFCRAKDTATLAFGRHTVEPDLLFVMNSDAVEAKRLGESLRRMLATAPSQGTNTVLISHSANLREAAGIFAKPEGAAYVFRPGGARHFESVARILPEDWARIAESLRSAKAP